MGRNLQDMGRDPNPLQHTTRFARGLDKVQSSHVYIGMRQSALGKSHAANKPEMAVVGRVEVRGHDKARDD